MKMSIKKRQYIKTYKLTKGCELCGYNKCARALDFHHIGEDKEFAISQCSNLEKIKKEIDKCKVICKNCHAELHEKEILSRRIKKAQKGGFAGGSTAMGYISKNKKLIIDKEQAETIRMIFKMKRYKKMSLRGIARELNKLNIPTSSGGGKWYGRTVKYILENPIYKGIAHYKEIKVKNMDLVLNINQASARLK